MTERTVRESLNQALTEELARDDRVFVYGEDVGSYGGIYQVTTGLQERFGEERVFDTPLSETAIVGSGVGAALVGARPVPEVMFADFLPVVADHLVNYAAKMHFNYGDETSVPLVVRTMYGAGDQFGLHHAQSAESWFQNVPGLKIVMPATPRDYKGLLKASIRDDDPVVFLEPKKIYRSMREEVPEMDEDHTIGLGEADVKKEGEDVTLVSWGATVHDSLEAAEHLEDDDIYAEVVDLRSISPMDLETIEESYQKTGKVVVAHEAAHRPVAWVRRSPRASRRTTPTCCTSRHPSSG